MFAHACSTQAKIEMRAPALLRTVAPSTAAAGAHVNRLALHTRPVVGWMSMADPVSPKRCPSCRTGPYEGSGCAATATCVTRVDALIDV